jgi:hypothetical protein
LAKAAAGEPSGPALGHDHKAAQQWVVLAHVGQRGGELGVLPRRMGKQRARRSRIYGHRLAHLGAASKRSKTQQ